MKGWMNEGLLRAGFQMTACLPDTIGQGNRNCRVIPWVGRVQRWVRISVTNYRGIA